MDDENDKTNDEEDYWMKKMMEVLQMQMKMKELIQMWTWTMNQRCDEYGETDDEEAGERRRPRKTIKSPKLVPEWCDKCN